VSPKNRQKEEENLVNQPANIITRWKERRDTPDREDKNLLGLFSSSLNSHLDPVTGEHSTL